MTKKLTLSELREKGIPVIMKQGVIVEYCYSTDRADTLILDLDDFPALKAKAETGE